MSVNLRNTSAKPLLTEGTLDPKTKELTLTGKGPGPDGQVTTHRIVYLVADADTVQRTMHVGEGKEPLATFTYKRRK